MTERRLTQVLCIVAAALLPMLAGAQAFPSSPIRLVVGYPPGGGTDTTARVVAQKLSETLGQQVVVENKPGATGIIAGQYVAKAKPDGYTVGTGTSSGIQNAAIDPTAYNPLRDLDPVARYGAT